MEEMKGVIQNQAMLWAADIFAIDKNIVGNFFIIKPS